MLIVKPYGRSETDLDKESRNLRRTLRLRPSGDGPRGIPEFAGSHPELVVAQWVSAIDKIAGKPAGKDLPTQEQRALRDRLGAAAWDILWDILKHMVPPEEKAELGKLWRRKIHPYGEEIHKSVTGREKGRWYGRFAGETEPGAIGEAEAAEIARRIEEHLHKTEYRIGGGRPDKRQGRIAARAESIAGNVAAQIGELPRDGWTDEDRNRYRDAADVAGAIRREAEVVEKAVEEKNRRVRPAVAARVLHAHYAKLFTGADGRPLSVAQAREEKPGLFALHGAVRETYTRILKNHGKDKKEHQAKRRRVSALLPADMDALFSLVDAMGRNRELDALVRLGKLIHYEAAPAGDEGDKPGFAIDRWPAAEQVERSHYRTSAGQAEIKRNEAFVRVWRGVAALAQRTLTGWADPDGKIGKDILFLSDEKFEDGFDENAYSDKLRLLFGGRSGIFETRADGRAVLRFALEGWRGLRNNAFHFTGRGGFVRALRQELEAEETSTPDAVREAVRELLRRDDAERWARLVASLRGAHVEHYYRQEQVEALLGALAAGAAAGTPLPRFRRVLDRTEKAWRQEKFRLDLPGPENRRAMEAAPGLLARYIVLKTLYERAFPAWLEGQDAAALNGWIDRAGKRATQDARKNNADIDAAARMAGLICLKDAEGIAVFTDFTDRLAAETASEYRVQRGYGNDPDAARKQAGHLEKLRCDVVAQAFEAYLKAEALDWTLADPADGPLPDKPDKNTDLDKITPPAAHGAGTAVEDWEDWRVTLYFLIHLVPVEAVAGLRHQLRKWTVLEGKADPDAAAVERILGLYLDMHDAKFEGGEGAAGAEAVKSLFETEALFRRVCRESPGVDDSGHVPWRGLREMLRFGGREPRLMPVLKEPPVDAGMVEALNELEAAPDGGVPRIAAAHARRESLHAKWIKLRKKFPDEDKQAYREALETVVAHRHRANHVRLVNHARLHRLAMAVLARLADYAGLWERDLYFATLAIVRLRGAAPADVFAPDETLEFLRKGQIVKALRKAGRKSESEHKASVKKELRRLFGKDFLHKDGKVGIRNRLAHFNMLQRGKNETFNLTEEVNEARRLMAYDRKLKNAVSRSAIELLARENLDLAWTMNGAHELGDAQLKSRHAVHLGDSAITEDLHGPEFVAMTAKLFGGTAVHRRGPGPERRSGTGPHAGSAQSPAASSPLPAPGSRVKAVLIEAKTKNGGWKAAVESGGRRIVGHIHNSGDVPGDAEPGLEVELVVKSGNPKAAGFDWPTPAVEARMAKAAAPRRHGQPGGRRR